MNRLLIFIATLLCTAPLHAQSTRYFLKFEPASGGQAVTGSSVIPNYLTQVELISFNLTGQNPVEIGGTSGAPATSRFASPDGVECLMQIDPKAISPMLQAMAQGNHFTKVLLTAVKFNSGNLNDQQVIMTVDLRLVFFSSVTQEGTNGDAPIVRAQLKFGAIQLTTNTLNPNGTTTPNTPFTWSIIKNNNSLNVN